MKTRFFLFALSCVILAACSSNSSNQQAAKQKVDSLAAIAQRDSLLNAAKMMHRQDSIENAKADSTKKADSAAGKK